MRNVVPILCCVCLLIGGSLLTAPASTTSTYLLPLTYTVATADIPQDIQQPAVVIPAKPATLDSKLVISPQYVDQSKNPDKINLEISMADQPCANGGCVNGVCPMRRSVSTVNTETTTTSTVAVSEERGLRLLGCVAVRARGVVGRVCNLLGCERRQERRATRRGG